MVIQKITGEEKTTFKPQTNSAEHSAKIWLWFGVGIFALTIFILWGWALKIRLDYFSWQKTPEKKIVESAKTDWNTYFSDTKKLEENKIKLKEALNKILTSTSTSTINTSTVEATINTSTTTTSTNNNQ